MRTILLWADVCGRWLLIINLNGTVGSRDRAQTTRKGPGTSGDPCSSHAAAVDDRRLPAMYRHKVVLLNNNRWLADGRVIEGKLSIIQVRPSLPGRLPARRRLRSVHIRPRAELFLRLQRGSSCLRANRQYSSPHPGGKTYTMGTAVSTLADPERLGIIPRVINQIFEQVEERRVQTAITVTASYL